MPVYWQPQFHLMDHLSLMEGPKAPLTFQMNPCEFPKCQGLLGLEAPLAKDASEDMSSVRFPSAMFACLPSPRSGSRRTQPERCVGSLRLHSLCKGRNWASMSFIQALSPGSRIGQLGGWMWNPVLAEGGQGRPEKTTAGDGCFQTCPALGGG